MQQQPPADKPAAPAANPPAPAQMPLATRQRIAQRMSQLLLIELGADIEVRRMVAQPLYARDVLLVCDAMRGSELARLAQQYRAAEAAEAEAEAEAASAAAPSEPPSSLWPESRSSVFGSVSLWPKTWFRNSRGGKPK